MIKNLRDARIKDGVPRIIADQDWVSTISEVMGMLQEKLLDFTDDSQIYTALDTVPETILDILAVNWKVEWYDSTYSIDQKRRVIKSAIQIRRRMGTVAAVKAMLASIFENPEIIEWFENGGEPGTFEVKITSTLSREDYENFANLISTTKRESAHLTSITTVSNIPMPGDPVSIGTIIETASMTLLHESKQVERGLSLQESIGNLMEAETAIVLEERMKEERNLTTAGSIGTILSSEVIQKLSKEREV